MSANNGNKQQKDSTESVKKALEQKTGAEWEAFKQRLELLQKIGALQQPDAFDQRLKELQKKDKSGS